jgi:hypothetical protein
MTACARDRIFVSTYCGHRGGKNIVVKQWIAAMRFVIQATSTQSPPQNNRCELVVRFRMRSKNDGPALA